MNIEICTEKDSSLIAKLNKELIEDEQSDNSMNMQELEERMLGFIAKDYKAFLFYENNEIIGYALVDVSRNPMYLRQFLIKREYRRKGYGKIAFDELLNELDTKTIDIEVLSWNKRGIAFWNSCGFKERSKYMRLQQ